MEKDNKAAPDVPMVEQYKVDAAIVHASRIVHDVKIIMASVMAGIVLIVLIFVGYYSGRQQEFMNTINMLTTKLAEVQNAKTVEQLPPP